MIISKPKKPNHPMLGSRIKIEPIRDKSAIGLIEENLSGHPRNLAIFTMGIYTGIRPSDMLLLTVDQARKAADSGELIFCEIKTGKLMQMHLPEKVRVAVTSWLQKRWKNRNPNPQTHLFVGSKGPLKTPTINKLVKKWCRDVGIEGNFGTLTLRKTYGYHMLLDGQKSLKEFKHFFNHSRGRETLNYLCIPPEEQARVRLNRESRHPADPTRGLLKRIADLETEIKELKQIDRENSRGHVFHKTIFENASDQIAFVDKNGIFLDVNEQAVDVFGFTRDEIVGQSIFDIEYMEPERMKKLFFDFYHVGHSPEKRVKEYQGIRKDKSTIYYEVSSRPVYKNDSLIGFVAIIRDITKRKEAEFELLKHRDQLEQ
ncbi:MAG: PAS domain S-box protein, partial [Deltaproteobacteria bacterium]|nr:PAS domain S-box protein [Deltaproteobacteria bacterium]